MLRKICIFFYTSALALFLCGTVTILGYASDGDPIIETLAETLGCAKGENIATVSDATPGKATVSEADNQKTASASEPAVFYTASNIITLPTPEREGYLFIEWNTDQNGNGDSYNAGDEFEIKDITLYAIWERDCATPSDADKMATVSEAKRKATDSDADDADDMIISDLEIY